MRTLILASASPYRAIQLKQLGLSFSQVPAAIDETPQHGELAVALCERLARAKATKIAEQHPGATVIGADQVVEVAGELCSCATAPAVGRNGVFSQRLRRSVYAHA